MNPLPSEAKGLSDPLQSDPGTLLGAHAVLGAHAATPLLLLHEAPLVSNVGAMQRLCDEAGARLMPHAKTTMSPQILKRQAAAGAAGFTVASVRQARALSALGHRRLLIANQVVQRQDLHWIAAAGAAPDGWIAFFVDSMAGIERIDAALRDFGAGPPLRVFVELGIVGGRGGVRSPDEAAALVGRLREHPRVRIEGLAAFEGILDAEDPATPVRLESWLSSVETCWRALAAPSRGQVPAPGFGLTFGSSVFPETVVDHFAPHTSTGDLDLILRSGCYVTHDDGVYQRQRAARRGCVELLDLRPALELWSTVLSTPEPGLAILDFGRRDVGVDAGLPSVRRRLADGDAAPRDLAGHRVDRLNDHHAMVVSDPGRVAPLVVGDRIGLGVSHPCTVLDKWRLLPVVDDTLRITDLAATIF